MAGKMMYIQGSMMMLAFLGYILRKRSVIEETGIRILSGLVTKFILPVNIFCTCMLSFSQERIFDMGVMILMGILVEIVLYAATRRMPFGRMSSDRKKIARYSLAISNGGLIGIPVIEGLYGSEGVMLANMFLIATRALLPVLGVRIFAPAAGKEFKLKQIFCNAGVLAVIAGVGLSILRLPLPDFVLNACSQISVCLSPVVLLLIGSMLYGNLGLKDGTEKKNIFELCILKQMWIPLLLLVVLRLVPVAPECKGIAVILMGMPLASATAMYAGEYGGDYTFAAKSAALSTVSSFLTLIFLAKITEILF